MKDDEWFTAGEIAKKLRVNQSSVTRIVHRKSLRIEKSGGPRYWKYNLPEVELALSIGGYNQHNARFINPSPTKSFTNFWQLNWDEFICMADIHVPLICEEIIDRMMEVATRWGIKKFIHAGDFFDQSTFSYFDCYHEDTVQWSDEIESAAKLHKTLCGVFDDVRYFMGSHDLRFWRMLESVGKTSGYNDAFLQAQIPNENTSRYRYAQIGTEWHLTHPRNTVRVNSSPAVQMGAKYERSLIIGHGHWWGMTMDHSSKHYHIAPGCGTDRRKHAYASLWDTSHPLWMPGFVAVVDKVRPILFNIHSPYELILGKKKGKK